jgi:hypothetical protein
MIDIASEYDAAVIGVIDREYGRLRHAAKILAAHAKASVPAAKHWLYGRRSPTGEHLLNLMAECKPMADEINRIVAERRANTPG